MKLYEYIKSEDTRTAKLLGFPVMEQTSDYMTAERYQSFLGGIITTIKASSSNYSSKKDIKLFGMSVIKRIEENGYRNYYAFGKKFRNVLLADEFKKQYFKYFDPKHDDIYILKANSGEIYLILTYIINSLIKRNNSKTPLLVATHKYHADIIKMICPDIPYVLIDRLVIKIPEDSFKIDNFRFITLFSQPYFLGVEEAINSSKLGHIHYFNYILKYLNISPDDIEMNKINILPQAEKSMLEKVNKMGLNLDKFVFLAPEAKSCKLYDEDFWCELIKRLQDKGYDVFVNSVDSEVKLNTASDFKTCYLTFAEAFALAKRAKKIVSLRSGFTEFLLQTGVPMDVLYTKFRKRHFFDDIDCYHVMSGFGLTCLPFVHKDKLREFNMFEISQKECLERIVEIGN